MSRRKAGQLIQIEIEILIEALRLAMADEPEFHGFAIAKELRDGDGSAALIGHGTLYKALGRLEAGGLLESRWEDPDAAAAEARPRRRLYHITTAGRTAANAAIIAQPPADPRWQAGIEPA
jgi:DNA-binding PadR family transcriptional regulator